MSTADKETAAQQTAIAIAQREPMGQEVALMRAVASVLGEAQALQLHNFIGNPKEVFRQIALCEAGEVKTRDQLGETPIDVKHFYAHRVELNGNTPGEIVEATRVVLITPDDKRYAFVSQGIAKSLGKIIHCYGLGPWNPPIKLQCVTIPTKGPNRTYALIPA